METISYKPDHKVCRKCGRQKHETEFVVNKRSRFGRTNECKVCRLAYLREWGSHPHSKELRHARHRRVLEKLRAEGGERLEKHLARRRQATKRRMHNSEVDKAGRARRKRRFYQKLSLVAIQRYGGRCECCGESTPEFLTLDHINGDGHKDKRTQKGDWHVHVARGPLRDDLRVLCYNCNCGRERNDGICPHERELRLVVNRK